MATNIPLISVNITTFNRAAQLNNCLLSVLEQSWPQLEINIVDDCSSDNTEALVRSYQSSDARIRYFRHTENKGNAFARNTALVHTSGQYIAFMDDDDVWIDRDKLAKQVALFESSQDRHAGLVCSSVLIVNETAVQGIEKRIEAPADMLYKILIGNGFIFNSTVLIKRAVVDKIGMFDTNIKRGIDSDFYRNCIVNGYNVLFLDDITTKVYEVGADRMTNKHSPEQIEKHIQSNLHKLDKYAPVLDRQKKAKSRIFEKVADHYKQLYKLTGENSKKNLARQYYAQSTQTYILNYRSVLKTILL